MFSRVISAIAFSTLAGLSFADESSPRKYAYWNAPSDLMDEIRREVDPSLLNHDFRTDNVAELDVVLVFLETWVDALEDPVIEKLRRDAGYLSAKDPNDILHINQVKFIGEEHYTGLIVLNSEALQKRGDDCIVKIVTELLLKEDWLAEDMSPIESLRCNAQVS